MKKYIYKIAAGIIILALLAFSLWHGADSPSRYTQISEENITVLQDAEPKKKVVQQEVPVADLNTKEKVPKNTQPEIQNSVISAPEKVQPSAEVQKTDESQLPQESTASVDSESTNENDELTCTLSVRCDAIFNSIDKLNPEKAEIIPKNGVVLEEITVPFYEGDSVFNLLVREMKRNKIHFEFVNVPLYNSAYIEGIANIYEFDCGELSGWMYKVNGWFPNYGCSNYQLQKGDKVELVYTCDLGKDIGGEYSARNGN